MSGPRNAEVGVISPAANGEEPLQYEKGTTDHLQGARAGGGGGGGAAHNLLIDLVYKVCCELLCCLCTR